MELVAVPLTVNDLDERPTSCACCRLDSPSGVVVGDNKDADDDDGLPFEYDRL